MKTRPKRKTNTKVDHDHAGHVYFVGYVYGKKTWVHVETLFNGIGIDYPNNGNKRAARYFDRTQPLMRRRKQGRAYWYGPRHPWMKQHEAKRISILPVARQRKAIERLQAKRSA